ncbi:hypothetical protein CXG81DRAFT_3943, partial [Caulochytrium protostelioides]
IQFGDFLIDTWFASPYPEEYNCAAVLYLCEHCLKYMASAYVLGRHRLKCPLRRPPGDEIYRDDRVSVYEVDGRKNKIYCQNLCLLAKMFLDHKTLYYDVEPFLFYVMTEHAPITPPASPQAPSASAAASAVTKEQFVGYFSKEKRSGANYNVSCILTMPHHQRKGYGHWLIDFSYLLSKREKICGTPEKPLSDLGRATYRQYWRVALLRWVAAQLDAADQIAEGTSMTPEDIVSTLYLLEWVV